MDIKVSSENLSNNDREQEPVSTVPNGSDTKSVKVESQKTAPENTQNADGSQKPPNQSKSDNKKKPNSNSRSTVKS